MRFFVLLLILSLGLQAQPWEKPSASEGLVVWRSAAKVLSAGDEEALETVLGAINDSTSTQIVVLFVDRVKDDLNFVAAQTGEAWGIGQAETDNGMLVLIALEDRKMAIQVGRGLEPTITDLVSHQLIENTLKPAFRNQDYRGGVQALAQEVAQRLAQRGMAVWDGNFYALSASVALGLEEHGGAIRVGFLHYTTPEEVDRLIGALGELG